EILPYRCGPRRERFPALDAAACAAAMHLVLPDGRMVTGAAAAPEVLRRLPFRGWLAGLASLPGGGAEWLARRLGLTCGSAEG
ncbi:MAG TPA: hypothetical protein VFX28_10180, partial [Methylomirabilota bacterium]|nr:hypothetical protein [Methylomirabilota bacterium]